MKKIKFLIKLKNERKLEIIEPSEEIAESYLKKSESHLEAAKILLKAKKLEESVFHGIFCNVSHSSCIVI